MTLPQDPQETLPTVSPANTSAASAGPRYRRVLAVMTKYPIPGAVKTRLGSRLGMRRASEAHRRMLTHLLGVLGSQENDRSDCDDFEHHDDLRREIVCSPADRCGDMRTLAQANWIVVPQSEGDLGQRIEAWLASHLVPNNAGRTTSQFDEPANPDKVVLVGADCPTLSQDVLDEVWRRLDTHDVVLIPAGDGGYVLIGLRTTRFSNSNSYPHSSRFHPADRFRNLWQNIDWSTDRVLRQTLDAAQQSGLDVITLTEHEDVDHVEDWLQVATSITSDPQSVVYDTVVVGGGIIGLSIAEELSRRGQSVAIVDNGVLEEQPADSAIHQTSTSWAAAGILPAATTHGVTDALDWLRGMSHERYPEWCERLTEQTGIDTGFCKSGGLYLAGSRAEAASMAGMVSYWSDLGIECQSWNAGALAERFPHLADWLQRQPASKDANASVAWYTPDEYQVRPPSLLQAVKNSCRLHDVDFIPLAMAGASREVDNRVELTIRYQHLQSAGTCDANDGPDDESDNTAKDILHAKRLVLCGGAATGLIDESLKLERSLIPVRGQMLLLHAEQPWAQTPEIINAGQRYLVSRGDGRVLVGSCEEEVGFRRETTEVEINRLKMFASDLIPELASAPETSRWSGLRPMTFDGMPMIGRVPLRKRTWVATGHFRSGIHLACGTASLIADLLTNKQRHPALEAFRVGKQQSH